MGALAPLLVGIVSPAGAQLKSVPVYPVVAARPGWAAAVDYGSGLNDASGHARHFGARFGAGVGRFQLTAAAGAWDAGASTSLQGGGTVQVRVLGRPSGGVALRVLAGLGYTSAGPAANLTKYLTVPLGMAVVRDRLSTPAGDVTPWLSPRLEITQVSFGSTRATQAGLGLAGGVAAMVRGKLGAHAAIEWVKLYQASVTGLSLAGGNRITAGAGVHLLLSRMP